MNIQRWLSGIVDLQVSSVPAQTATSDVFHRPEKPRPVFDEHRAPNRSKSDSSLLVPRSHSHRASPNVPKPSTENGANRADSEGSQSGCSENTESESSSQRYARKPRHKTRLERYEPKQHKEPAKHVHQSRKSESKRLKRKSKRKKGEQSDSGVAQNFHAKNVSGDRLTLKPRDQLGIFNKGMASTATRGRGLPDLVFSEMRFLQKEKDQPESAPQYGTTKKKRKKDHKHTKEGEISAFFTAVRPVLAEHDGNIRPIGVRADNSKTATASNREREQSLKSSTVLPTIEVSEKAPFLRSRSRDPRHESTSYVSWSDSVRASDLTYERLKHMQANEKESHVLSKHRDDGAANLGEDTEFKRTVPSPVTRQQRNESSGRFRISSMAPSQARISRSHSYPQEASSPRKVNLVDRAVEVRSTDSVASPSLRPHLVTADTRIEDPRPGPSVNSNLTEYSAMRRPATSQVTRSRQVEPTSNSDMVMEQQTSSDLGMAIQQCHHTFQYQRRAVESPRQRSTALRAIDIGDRYSHPPATRQACRRPVVRFSEVELPSSRLPNFPGPSIYEQQTYQRRDHSHIKLDDDALLDNSYVAEQNITNGDDDMLYEDGDWEAQLEEPLLYEETGIVEDEYEMEELRAPHSTVQHLTSHSGVVAPGFWRPNKLY